MEQFIGRLKEYNIGIDVVDGRLKLKVPDDCDATDIINEVRENKEALISFINEIKGGVQFRTIEPASKKPYYKISSAQKRLWFLYEFEKESLTYNMPEFVKLTGDLNKERFKNALNELISRHESLRTFFCLEDGEPVQKIAEEVHFETEYYDGKVEEVQTILDRFIRPFDLSKAPLIRAGLIETEVEEHLLMVDFHHIITDGVSQGILIRDFMDLYNQTDLPELHLQYKDYAEWQQGAEQQVQIAKQQTYWLDTFAEQPEVLDLPTDYARPLVSSHRGATAGFKLNKTETLGLKEMANEQGTTMYMVVLSLFNVLLSKLGNQEDIVIGTPTAGRLHPDLEEMIGMFVNTLALRNYPKGNLTFIEFLNAVSSNTLSGFDNQSYPYEELIDKLKVERDTSRNPLFDVMFSWRNFGESELKMSGLQVTSFDSDFEVSKFDLTLMASENNDQVDIGFQYATDLFERETIERFGGYFRKIVSAVLSDVNIRLSAISVLSEEEKHQLLVDFNDSDVAYGKDTIISLFRKQASVTPDHIALTCHGEQITYQGLNEKSDQLAAYLLTDGVKQQDVVALWADRTIEVIIGIVGILKAGAIYLPIDPAQPKSRIEHMLNDSGAMLLLADGDKKKRFNSPIKTLDLQDCLQSTTKGIALTEVKLSDVAYIIYTSGSTGHPKGVMIAHGSVANLIQSQKETFGIDEQDRILQFSTLAFDASVEQIWLALTSGSTLVLINRETLADHVAFDQYVATQEVTHLHATPSFLEVLELNKPNSVKRIVSGGEECKASLVNKFIKDYEFFNKYGPTETTVTATISQIKDQFLDENTKVSIGKPVGNTKLYILDKNLELVPQGIKGELYIGGKGLAKGYVKDSKLTRSSFVKNPHDSGTRMYKTGDLARWQPDGNIEYLGRIDHQVKIRGFRIELGEIEYQLTTHKQIREVVVIAKEKEGDKYLIAYCVSAEEVNSATLRTYLSGKLPDYMIPSYFIQIESIPLTISGKLDRRSLPDPEYVSGEGYVAPSTDTERKLVSLWSKVLKIEEDKISVTRGFFEMGGHSLKAAFLVNKIRKELSSEVSLKEFFQHQSIIQLSKYIETSESAHLVPIMPVEEKVNYVLSAAQKRLYFLYKLDPTSVAYNLPQVVKLKGKVDKEKLASVFTGIVGRHEILRTTFEQTEEEPFQKINDQVSFEVEHYSCSEAEINTTIKTFVCPFDLSAGPLIRAGVIETEAGEYFLMTDLHHIITDGVSQEILVREFMALYNDEVLPVANLQYKDYAEWQQSREQQSEIAKQRSFWLETFAEPVSVLDLPTDYTRQVISSHNGATIELGLSEIETLKLKEIAQAQGTTMFMVVLSIFNVLLSKLGNQEDIVVGIATAGRSHPDLEDMIGMFVNTLPLRNYPKGELTFAEFLTALSSNTLSAFDNQSYPYEELIDELKVERDTGRNPLFDVMFSYQHVEESEQSMSGLMVSSYANHVDVSKFDLTLAVTAHRNQLFLGFQYATDLFKTETIARFVGYFRQIVSAVLADAKVRLSDISILSDGERHQLLTEFNDTVVSYGNEGTVMELFEAQAKQHPENVAIRYAEKEISYEHLKIQSDQIATWLIMSEGIKKGDLVGVMLEREENLVAVLFGIMKAGAAWVPIDPSHPTERIKAIADDSGIRCLITRSKFQEPVAGSNIKTIDLDQCPDGIPSGQSKVMKLVIGGHDLAYVIYTSGSTGKPKGVMVEHRSLLNIIQCMQEKYPLGEADSYLLKTTFTFDVSCAELFGWFPGGGSLAILPPGAEADPAKIMDEVQSKKVTHLNFVPSLFSVYLDGLIDRDVEKIKSLKYIFLAGEALPADLIRRFRLLNTSISLENLYGPTEATIYASGYSTIDFDTEKLVPIGKPLDNIQLLILDKCNHLQPLGVSGELCISGDSLARGYLNNTALTNEKFVSNPFREGTLMYKTGDLARWLPNGNIEYLGRIDDQVKIRGFRIELGEIGYHLTSYSQIREGLVLVHEGGGDKYLVAYYASDQELENSQIRSHLQSSLPEYMVPAHFVHLEQLPLNSNGKVNKKALPDPEIKAGQDYEPPQNELEEQLVNIWSEILMLGQDQISVTRSFFELGGHSLRATAMVNKISKKLGIEIPLVEVFISPTIRTLAQKIKSISDPSGIERDELMISLKTSKKSDPNVFFVHDASGDVQTYVEMCKHVAGFNCWGLRSYPLDHFSFEESTLENMASRCIDRLRRIQTEGPYYLAGFSFGGMVAHEMAFQLEEAGHEVVELILIDSVYAMYNLDGKELRKDQLGNQMKNLDMLLAECPPSIEESTTSEELWDNLVTHVNKNSEEINEIKKMIPEYHQDGIPNFDTISVEDLVVYLKILDHWQAAMLKYRPKGVLNAKCSYIKATNTDFKVSLLSDNFKRKIAISKIDADHLSVMTKTNARKVAETVQMVIKGEQLQLAEDKI